MTREDKINMLNSYLEGIKPAPIPDYRPELCFTRVGDNLYQATGSNEIVTLQDIDNINKPYKQIKGQVLNWEEVKHYDDREETHIGLPLLVQINVRGRDSSQPYKVILPAIRCN